MKNADCLDSKFLPLKGLDGNIIALLRKTIPDAEVVGILGDVMYLAVHVPKNNEIYVSPCLMNYIWLFCFFSVYFQEIGCDIYLSSEQKAEMKAKSPFDINDPALRTAFDKIEGQIIKVVLSEISLGDIDLDVFPSCINTKSITDSLTGFVSSVNAIYVRAIAFILFHEFGHKNLKHTCSCKENERAADRYAFDILMGDAQTEDELLNNCYGILSALFACLCLYDINKLIEDTSHPTLLERISSALEELKKHANRISNVNYLEYFCSNILVNVLCFRGENITNFYAGADINKYLADLFEKAKKYFVDS